MSIIVNSLNKSFKTRHQRVEVLKGVSFEIKQGEIIAITGKSGSGKSTLLNVIGGLDNPTSGQIIINDQDVSKLKGKRLAQFRNKTIGFVFQSFYLQPFLTVTQNIEMPGVFAKTKPGERKKIAQNLAKIIKIDHRLNHLPRELSGGEAQRAALARALFNQPKIILADEPTGNLDSINSEIVIRLLELFRKKFNTTIIIVTHDLDLANRADRKITLKDGVIV